MSAIQNKGSTRRTSFFQKIRRVH